MQLVLDPSENCAHGDWLRANPGAYEWWYFDALSDNGVWALTVIWFLGNPFSSYYRECELGKNPNPYQHNALFISLYKHGALHSYHFTQFPTDTIIADNIQPATLQFGSNQLSYHNGVYKLSLSNTNGNRTTLDAEIVFRSPLENAAVRDCDKLGLDSHFWLPAAPHCTVSGTITLREPQNYLPEQILIRGTGYHDHNWGTLPFPNEMSRWYWARASFADGRALIVYHVVAQPNAQPTSYLLLYEDGQLVSCDSNPYIQLSRYKINSFGVSYASRLTVHSQHFSATIDLGKRLDSAPFYIRTFSHALLKDQKGEATGTGIGEYFCPRSLGSCIAASATKARIMRL